MESEDGLCNFYVDVEVGEVGGSTVAQCVSSDGCWGVVFGQCCPPEIVVGVGVDGFSSGAQKDEVFGCAAGLEAWVFELFFAVGFEFFDDIEEWSREWYFSVFAALGGGFDDDAVAWFSDDCLVEHHVWVGACEGDAVPGQSEAFSSAQP